MNKYMKNFIKKYDVYDNETKSISLSKVVQYIDYYSSFDNDKKEKFISEFNKMYTFNQRIDKIKRLLDEN